MASKRQTQKADTRAKLLASAKARFEVTGYDATGMRDIAQAAGMSTGAVFANWTGKAELYREIYGHDPVSVEHGRALLLAARAVYAGSGDPGALNWLKAVVDQIDDSAPQTKAAA